MNLIKSHKIVTATILVGIIGSAVGIAVINQPVDNQVRHVSEMEEPTKADTKSKVEKVEKAESIDAPQEVASDTSAVEAVEEPVIKNTQSTEPVEELVQEDSFWHVANNELNRIGYDAHRREAHLLAGYMARNLGSEPLPKSLVEQRARECAELSNSFGFTPREQYMAQMRLTLEPCWTS